MMIGGFLWLLIFAGLIYVMIRFGCGSHKAHASHGDQGQARHSIAGSDRDLRNDPVCGMPVSPGQGYVENREGRQFRFCSKQCLDKFDAELQRYGLQGG